MFDFIKNHAVQNVWCSPEQDKQIILRIAKITPMNGKPLTHRVMWRKHRLPDNQSSWHVFQIGGIHPLLLGLLPTKNTWTSFAQACNTQKMICDIYTINGVNIPRFETFYMFNQDRDLIVAIKQNKKINFDFNDSNIFLRVYSNAYFQSNRSDQLVDKVVVQGTRPLTTQQILNFQAVYETHKALPGVVNAFVNGYRVKNINLLSVNVGDTVEFVYDSSVIKTVDFKIRDLNVFESILDLKRKYLLHYTGQDNQTIDFHDDIDVFLVDTIDTNKERGFYYHRNKGDSFRNVTHRDYAITVPYIEAYLPTIGAAAALDGRVFEYMDLTVRLHIRKSGYQRPLVFENSRIKELYKLSDTLIVRAMLNIDSNVDVWKAANLENSFYTKIMRSRYSEITNEIVQKAYGYNAISKVIGDNPNPTFPFSGFTNVNVPYGLQQNSTAYEYDQTGNLLGFYHHTLGSNYSCVNSNAKLVEFIPGIGSKQTEQNFGLNNVPIPPNDSYRVYACKNLIATGPDNNWQDVTGTDKYIVQNNKVVWADTTFDPYICVRTNNKFLAYNLSLPVSLGQLKFTFTESHLINNTVIPNQIAYVPYGQLDIFLNGKSLIRDLDYIVNYPEVVITNKEYLINPLTTEQKLVIRFTDFCDNQLKLIPKGDVGFIQHGFLSNNNKFDIRDDKVLRIVLNGNLVTRDALEFSEEHPGVGVLDADNGKPYEIKDIIIHLRGLVAENTYSLRQKSIVIDNIISSYLTLKFPQPQRPAPSAIPSRYEIYSPFFNKLIFLLKDNVLDVSDLGNLYSDNQVITKVTPYLPLLNFDPIMEKNAVDGNFVIIHPHMLTTVIDLKFEKYRFMERVAKLYGKNVVSLSPFVRVEAF